MSESVAIVGTVAAAAGPPSRPPLPGETRQRSGTAPAGCSSAETVPETPATARHAAESAGRSRARIHTETVRVIAEIVDMTTGDVLIYLPPGYRQSDDGAAASTEAGTDAYRRGVRFGSPTLLSAPQRCRKRGW